MTLLMTGRDHWNDPVTGLLFGASAVVSTGGIKPSGGAPVMSALEYNPH